MVFIVCVKHYKNFVGISSCDTLSSPMRQALLLLTNENIETQKRTLISNYEESADVTRDERAGITGEDSRSLSYTCRDKEMVNYTFSVQKSREKIQMLTFGCRNSSFLVFYP